MSLPLGIAQPGDEFFREVGPGINVKELNAFVSYSGTFYEEGIPITNHIVVPLEKEGTTQIWSATLSANSQPQDGQYSILYVAIKDDGYGVDLASVPVARFLYVGSLSVESHWTLYP